MKFWVESRKDFYYLTKSLNGKMVTNKLFNTNRLFICLPFKKASVFLNLLFYKYLC